MLRLRYRWSFSLGTLLMLVTAVAAGAWYWSLSEFQAVAVLHFNGPEDSAAFERFEREQIELISSQRVLEAALHDPEVTRLPGRFWLPHSAAALRRGLDFDLSDEDEIIRVVFRSHDAQVAATIANAVTRAYVRDVVERERQQYLDRLDELKAAFRESERETHGQQAELKRLADRGGSGGDKPLSQEDVAARQQLTSLGSEQLSRQIELLRTKLARATLDADLNFRDQGRDPDEALVETYMLAAPEIRSLQRQIKELEQTLKHSASSPGDGHDRLQEDQRAELKNLTAELAAASRLMRARIARDVSRSGRSPQRAPAFLEAQELEISTEMQRARTTSPRSDILRPSWKRSALG